MKKLLAVFDGTHFSESTIDFAARLNETETVLLTGIFLRAVDYADILVFYAGGLSGPLYIPEAVNESAGIAENIKRFEDSCRKKGIEYRVHKEEGDHVLDAIRKETRYADLLLISSSLFYENMGAEGQKSYISDTLHHAECPVILMPEHCAFPESVIIAYDGSASAVFALKQFAYLFPGLSALSTLIVYASAKEDEFPDMPYIEELAARHFSDLTFFKLEAKPTKYFETWIAERGNALLVTGAAGRSRFSEVLKRSFADDVIDAYKLPVFIAHT
ncbi:hypothetical protein ACTHGU_06200 [Chitinophagaceae bacterium MMS25-I14]